jgi:predicted nucleic acid-binding protein
MVDKSDIKVICLTEHDLEAAWHTINAYADQSFSFTDCTTFSIMERLRISDVFTFDHIF